MATALATGRRWLHPATRLPQFAKLSASLGACYAEQVRRNRFAPRDSRDDLRRGVNIVYFDINNLFSYLPTTFSIRLPDSQPKRIFEAGRELFEIYGDDSDQQRGCARTEWGGAAIQVNFDRTDYTNGFHQAWGYFSAQELANQLGMSDRQWQESIRYQYEIDHRLNITILMFRQDNNITKPIYRLSGKESALDLVTALPKIAERLSSTAPKVAASLRTSASQRLSHAPLWNSQRILQCSIYVGTSNQTYRLIFEDGQKTDVHIYSSDGTTSIRAALSKNCIESFSVDDTLYVYIKLQGSDGLVCAGQLHRPGEKPLFRRQYRFSLDEKGVLRLHNGEPHYQETSNFHDLKDKPGWALH